MLGKRWLAVVAAAVLLGSGGAYAALHDDGPGSGVARTVSQEQAVSGQQSPTLTFASWAQSFDSLIPGTEYLLFLKRDPSTGNYFVLAGPEGRFVLKDGNVSSLSTLYPGRHIADLGISNMSLSDATANLH